MAETLTATSVRVHASPGLGIAKADEREVPLSVCALGVKVCARCAWPHGLQLLRLPGRHAHGDPDVLRALASLPLRIRAG